MCLMFDAYVCLRGVMCVWCVFNVYSANMLNVLFTLNAFFYIKCMICMLLLLLSGITLNSNGTYSYLPRQLFGAR